MRREIYLENTEKWYIQIFETEEGYVIEYEDDSGFGSNSITMTLTGNDAAYQLARIVKKLYDIDLPLTKENLDLSTL